MMTCRVILAGHIFIMDLREVRVISTGQHLKRLVVVSNRGPIVIRETTGGISATRTIGGLVSAVEPVLESTGGLWISWCGRKTPGTSRAWPLPKNNPRYAVREVSLDPQEYRDYYLGFANGCLWPLAHSFIDRCVINSGQWQAYQEVNLRFAAVTAAEWEADDVVWIHDFHLTLVPEMLRKARPQARIAFFWHIPFPPFDLFSILPWAKDLLQGLLNCDHLAFHSSLYADNFLQCVSRLLGADTVDKYGLVRWQGRQITVRSLPIGVDAARFRTLAEDPRVQQRAAAIRRAVGTRFLALGADRLDYTKGILERLQAIELFLERYPEYRHHFTFLQVAVPTRTEGQDYRDLRRMVEETVGRINGRFGEQWRVPVRYQFRSLSPEYLVAHYLAADVAMVTPLRDGLNLVAKEYVASRLDHSGVLLLSPFAGAAEQLTEAVLANPYHPDQMAEQIHYALEMPPEEQKRRMQLLQQNVEQYDLAGWWENVVDNLAETCTTHPVLPCSTDNTTVREAEKVRLAPSPA